MLHPYSGICSIDLRHDSIKSVVPEACSFDIDSNELVSLYGQKLTYYDIRNSTRGTTNGEIDLKQNDRGLYTYIKADIHRVGLMSPSSLLFKNHGEVNETGKSIHFMISWKRSIELHVQEHKLRQLQQTSVGSSE